MNKEITPFSSKLIFAGMILYQLVIYLIVPGAISPFIIGTVAGAVGGSLVIGILIGLIPHAMSKSVPKQTTLSYGFKASAWISVLLAIGRSADLSVNVGSILVLSVVYYLVLYGVGLFIDGKTMPKKKKDLADFSGHRTEQPNTKEHLIADVEFGQSSFRIKNNNDKSWSEVRLSLNNRFYMIYPRDIAPGKSALAPYHEFILEDGSRFNIRQSVVKQLDIDASIENTAANASFANRKYVQ